jgi:protein-disulfide isomerase
MLLKTKLSMLFVSLCTCLLILSLSGAALAHPLLAELKPNLMSKDFEQAVLEVIKRNPDVIIDSVRAYQTKQSSDQRRADLQRSAQNPVKVDIRRAPKQGAATAPFTLVEFSDFQCPYCIRVQPTLKTFLAKYKGQIQFAYLHLPLSIHTQAKAAAQATWAADQQGKFFEYHDRLFALDGNLQADTYWQVAKELGLDIVKFNRDRQSPQAVAYVEADIKQADQLGIQSTPTFVLNGILFTGALPLEGFEEVMQIANTQMIK